MPLNFAKKEGTTPFSRNRVTKITLGRLRFTLHDARPPGVLSFLPAPTNARAQTGMGNHHHISFRARPQPGLRRCLHSIIPGGTIYMPSFPPDFSRKTSKETASLSPSLPLHPLTPYLKVYQRCSLVERDELPTEKHNLHTVPAGRNFSFFSTRWYRRERYMKNPARFLWQNFNFKLPHLTRESAGRRQRLSRSFAPSIGR